jgi:hypothetical protein
VDQNGIQIGVAKKLDAQGEAAIGDSFSIPAGATQTYTVSANIASCKHACADDGQNISIAVIGVETSKTLSGEMPIVGAQHVMNSHLILGSVSGSSISTPTRGRVGQNITFSKLQFFADGAENLMLYSIRFKYTGTANISDLQNVRININGVDSPVVWTTDWKYATAAFLGGLPLPKGQLMDVFLHGDVAPSNAAGRSAAFGIEVASDVYFVGQTFGYGIQPSGI